MPPTTRKRPSTAAAKPEQKNLSDDDEKDVDEPDELQDLSEDEWTPDPSAKGKKAPSRRGPQTKKKKVSFDEDDSDEGTSKKKTPTKSKAKSKPTKTNGKAEEDSAEDSEEDEDEDEDSEGDGEAEFEGADAATEKEFPPGSFVVLKTHFDTMDEPPIWRIDGKTLLQKYLPHKDDEDSKDEPNLYISTSSFNFWNHKVKDKYYPAPVKYKQQKGTDRIVEFQRDLIKNENGDGDGKATE